MTEAEVGAPVDPGVVHEFDLLGRED
jgi:hypothetical protein